MFEGIMRKELFVEILDGTLLPFVKDVYPSDHKFMQNNDPKHTTSSGYAEQWMKDNGISWWKTAVDSPNLNPIENLWHELKEYVHPEVKPKMKDERIKYVHPEVKPKMTDELVTGIIEF